MSVNTTGDLRKLLAETIEEVKAGEIGLAEASKIVKLAAQINESFYSEIKVIQVLKEASEATHPLGDLPLS